MHKAEVNVQAAHNHAWSALEGLQYLVLHGFPTDSLQLVPSEVLVIAAAEKGQGCAAAAAPAAHDARQRRHPRLLAAPRQVLCPLRCTRSETTETTKACSSHLTHLMRGDSRAAAKSPGPVHAPACPLQWQVRRPSQASRTFKHVSNYHSIYHEDNPRMNESWNPFHT